MGRSLTARQQMVYEFIYDKISNRGYGPTVREIGEFLGIKSPNGVISHLRALERKGMISRAAHKSRAIELTNRSSSSPSPGLPIRGKVHNGSCNLFDAPQTLDDLDALQHPERFLLQYYGDDLRDWAIADGDILVVEQSTSSADGCVELVRVDTGALYLRPSTLRGIGFERMALLGGQGDPIVALATAASPPAPIEVIGVVVGIIRTLPRVKGADLEQPGSATNAGG